MNDSRAPVVIDLVYFNAGGGHRAAATALETVIREQGRPWQVRLVNLMEILDPKDVFRKTTGMDSEDLYNTRLARGWNIGSGAGTEAPAGADPLEPQIDRRSAAPILAQNQARPGGFAHTEFQSRHVRGARAARPEAPYVTILTDFADFAAAFLDRARPGAALHLRHPEGGGAGARHGLCARAESTRRPA